jgi:putative phosphoribosyl transferase
MPPFRVHLMPKHAAIAEDEYLFRDRTDAGRQLAKRIIDHGLQRPLVLAMPRGGVPVALEIAAALQAPLDLLLVRKIGLPWQPELAVGAVVDGGRRHTVINEKIARTAHMDETDITRIANTQLEEIDRRCRLWLSRHERLSIAGRTVIVVDDGVATGASARVARDAVKTQNPSRVILAAPVAPIDVAEALRKVYDDTMFLATPENFVSVGMYYRDFHQLSDDEVKKLLDRAWNILPAQ